MDKPPLLFSRSISIALLLAFGSAASVASVASVAEAQSDTWLVLPVEVQGQPSSAVDVATSQAN